ncbi:hypothetical protein L6452_34745 [Arctium lappa]|uniref:Uncharacterized protein n=1 Tax=Arctium lappa TaxID=4217 RepID=A0ACB8YJS0_ARCLA|nr:hypothetical protein L6452_34745 [Arctium lappa]
MAEGSRMGCCAINFLHRIKSIDTIASINWSRYIFNCLKRSKRRWRNDTYDSFYAGPLTFLTLLYVESTIWNNEQLGTSEPPLHKWNMIELRNRQQSAIKGGGFQRAMIRGPVQPSNKNHENTTPSPAKDNKEDEESVKKGYILELNEMFAILMRTKVDANTVIEKAKERFPSESIFERYEDELAILFNETGFRGSGKNKQPTTLVGCSHSSKKNQQSDPDEKHDVLCTPTKLNFDQMESLDALSPLSPYWYSQTTYGLIDAEIQEKAVGKV